MRKQDDAQRALFKTFHVVMHLCDFEGVPREKLGEHYTRNDCTIYGMSQLGSLVQAKDAFILIHMCTFLWIRIVLCLVSSCSHHTEMCNCIFTSM